MIKCENRVKKGKVEVFWVGLIIRVISAASFCLGIITCLFSIKTGLIMVLSGIVFWNVGAKLLEIGEKNNQFTDQNQGNQWTGGIEAEKGTQRIINKPIDYSGIPYDLSAGWRSSDNRFQALTDISYMNEFLKEARKLGNIKQKLEICTEEVLWDGVCVSTLEKLPRTKTGKVPKYIVKLWFSTRDGMEFEPPDHYYGDIYYMQDGTIGKAWLVCRIKKKMYCIYIGLVGTSLVIKKIETNASKKGEKEIIYKR